MMMIIIIIIIILLLLLLLFTSLKNALWVNNCPRKRGFCSGSTMWEERPRGLGSKMDQSFTTTITRRLWC
jgi:hypothetical protein